MLAVGLRRLAKLERVLTKIRATAPERSLRALEREIRHQERLNRAIKEWGL
jgi:hypothetical protein